MYPVHSTQHPVLYLQFVGSASNDARRSTAGRAAVEPRVQLIAICGHLDPQVFLKLSPSLMEGATRHSSSSTVPSARKSSNDFFFELTGRFEWK